jgi:molybdopterin-guanine dinucleotide biosynthesis protein A
MIAAPRVFMVGGCGRAVGKTAFACALIGRFGSQRDLVAVKATTIDSCNRSHHLPRVDWITEETNPSGGKDTSRMLASGARRALWLQAPEDRLQEGLAALFDALGPGTISVWESTRACRFVEPGAFVLIERPDTPDRKPWAAELVCLADRVVSSDGTAFDFDWGNIQLIEGRWAVRMQATAILLAGGGSTRMGTDKAMLAIDGRPMIQRIHDRLRPWFSRVLVSSNNAAHGFLGATIVPDQAAGQGPLMGIVSALTNSPDELCFVTACDIPEIDIDLVRMMVRAAHDCDAVVPHSGRPEPLFAVYRKSALPVFRQMLASGRRRMTDVLDRCKVKYVPVMPGRIRNLNMMSEYRQYVSEADHAHP